MNAAENDDTTAETADVVAFGAHPDDVELAMGGCAARLVEEGRRVVIVDLTRGELGTRGDRETRDQEAVHAAAILGVQGRECLELPDGHLTSDRSSRAAVIGALRRHRPSLVFAPAEWDLHPDHGQAGQLVRESCFLAGLRNWDTGQPPHRPRTVLHYFLHTQHEPDLVMDISNFFKTKLRACEAFKSQFHNEKSQEPETYISSSKFWVWWEARSRHYGNLIGAEYGEPFLHRGPLPVADPVAMFENYGYYPRSGMLRGEDDVRV